MQASNGAVGSFTNCKNTGTITAASSSGAGIVCTASGAITIQNCSNSGKVSGVTSVGGIVGTFGTATAKIIACYNTGAVTRIQGNYAHVGGICGSFGGIMVACYNKGAVSVSGTAMNTRAGAGGIAGNVSSAKATITACYSTGTVSSNTTSTAAIYVGGISGAHISATSEPKNPVITACYWKGDGEQYGIGGVRNPDATTEYNASNTGTYKFASGVWPSTTVGEGDGHADWGSNGDGDSGGYWKTLGTWDISLTNLPKLWFED
jgi:hypothetical protein